MGSPEHFKHYNNEYVCIKKLADNSSGNQSEILYMALDQVTMIFEDYIP